MLGTRRSSPFLFFRTRPRPDGRSERFSAPCQFCKAFDLSNIADASTTHQPTFAALRDFASAGCGLCQFFLAKFRDKYAPEMIQDLLPDRNECNIGTTAHLDSSFDNTGMQSTRGVIWIR